MFDTTGAHSQLSVQPVVMQGNGAHRSVTVVDGDFEPIGPIEPYLAHLVALERSPNTVRAYATSLKLFFEFLADRGVEWDAVNLEDVGRFLSWLRSPAEGVVLLDATAARRSEATVNRYLAAVFSFYEFHLRRGVAVATDLVSWRRGGRASYKPFLEQVGGALVVSLADRWVSKSPGVCPRRSAPRRSPPCSMRVGTCGTASCSP